MDKQTRTERFFINDYPLDLLIEGPTTFGQNCILLHEDDDLTRDTNWANKGYLVLPLPQNFDLTGLMQRVTDIVKQTLFEAGAASLDGFTLENYHLYVGGNERIHLNVAKRLSRGLSLDQLPFHYSQLDDISSNACGVKVSCSHEDKISANRFCIRLVRPKSKTDYNPPHKDVWLDRLTGALNMYLPLAGSNSKSSLPILPGSQFWKESAIERTAEGAKVNGATYSVPCVVGGKEPMQLIRPEVATGEAMFFTPHLIHGGGANQNEATTRVSLEMRFWRV